MTGSAKDGQRSDDLARFLLGESVALPDPAEPIQPTRPAVPTRPAEPEPRPPLPQPSRLSRPRHRRAEPMYHPLPGAFVVDLVRLSPNPDDPSVLPILAPPGSPVHAVAAGRISLGEKGFVLRTDDGYEVTYGGVDLTVAVTDPVAAGHRIGAVQRATADRTGIRLEVRAPSGEPLNPYDVLVRARDPLSDSTSDDWSEDPETMQFGATDVARPASSEATPMAAVDAYTLLLGGDPS